MNAVAKALLYDENNNVLIMSRSGTHPQFPHKFDLPGGKIDPGETALEGMIREVFEEAGLVVNPERTVLAGERVTAYGRHDMVYTIHIDGIKPPVAISWEHESYEWINQEDVHGYIDSVDDDYMVVVKEYFATK